MSCGVGRRCSLDPAWPWLQLRPAGVVLIQPLSWELPYALGGALKRQGKKKKEKKKKTLKKPEGVPQTFKCKVKCIYLAFRQGSLSGRH